LFMLWRIACCWVLPKRKQGQCWGTLKGAGIPVGRQALYHSRRTPSHI
jgi:hypothetical protein